MDINLLKEDRIHGNDMLPLDIYDGDYYFGSDIFSCHWHDELELLLVTKGKGIFQIGTTYHEVYEGQALIINSGEIHAGYTTNKTSCNFYAVVFNPAFLYSNSYDVLQLKYLDPLIQKRFLLPSHIKGLSDWENDILLYTNKIIDIFKSKAPTYELQIKAYIYLILSLAISNSCLISSNESISNNYKLERLKNVLEYIQINYNKKLNIKELASLQNLSEGHFCRFFKQMVRKTPVEYINYYRIRKSASLLESTNNKILDISMEVGFDNFSYFINTFKNYMKCTPSEYRKKTSM